jgi:hypothetical protein
MKWFDFSEVHFIQLLRVVTFKARASDASVTTCVSAREIQLSRTQSCDKACVSNRAECK